MAADAPEPPFDIADGEGILRVKQRRPLANPADARAGQMLLEQGLDRYGVKRVLLDQSAIGSHAEDVREAMWKWAQSSGKVEAIALVLADELSGVIANMTAVSRKVKLRAFTELDTAEDWLRKTVIGHTTGFFKPMD